MLLKMSLTMLRVMSSLLKMTGSDQYYQWWWHSPLGVMWFQTPTCSTRNCVTWNLTAAEQGLKFQFWSNLKSFDVKFKCSNLAGCDLKLKLPNGPLYKKHSMEPLFLASLLLQNWVSLIISLSWLCPKMKCITYLCFANIFVLISLQACQLVDKPSFCHLLQYLRPSLSERDIPHHTKIHDEILF